jgi:hypothetical protein
LCRLNPLACGEYLKIYRQNPDGGLENLDGSSKNLDGEGNRLGNCLENLGGGIENLDGGRIIQAAALKI